MYTDRVDAPHSTLTLIAHQKDTALHRKQSLSRLKYPPPRPHPKPAPVPKQLSPPSTPVASSSKADSQEEEFWHTPAAAARTLRFTHAHNHSMDLLMDEEVDLANVTTSFENPLPSTGIDLEEEDDKARLDYTGQTGENEPEDTVILPTRLTLPHIPSPREGKEPEAQSAATAETPRRLRVNSEVERIVVCTLVFPRRRATFPYVQAKIWTTVGDIFMPGSQYSEDKPRKAKEMMYVSPFSLEAQSHLKFSAHLQTLSAFPLSPTPSPLSSPSLSSHSGAAGGPSKPSSQQILTAHLLLALLNSPPHFSMPLGAVKDVLAARAQSDMRKGEGGEVREREKGAITIVSGQNTTRALYALVAKRLVKIERGGGEQIVKFDL